MQTPLWVWEDAGGEPEFTYEERRELLPNGLVIESCSETWHGDYALNMMV